MRAKGPPKTGSALGTRIAGSSPEMQYYGKPIYTINFHQFNQRNRDFPHLKPAHNTIVEMNGPWLGADELSTNNQPPLMEARLIQEVY